MDVNLKLYHTQLCVIM